MTVHVLPVWVKNPYNCLEVSTVSSSGMYRELSPFILGPIDTYVPGLKAQTFENLWQYSKVYKEHTVDFGPSRDYFNWRDQGWANPRAVRYPMGKGRKPEFSYWGGKHYGYIEARKFIYARLYAKNVARTTAFDLLKGLYTEHSEITLKDYDAYDHLKMGMSLKDVINNPNRIMGHAFVLAMLLMGELEECLK